MIIASDRMAAGQAMLPSFEEFGDVYAREYSIEQDDGKYASMFQREEMSRRIRTRRIRLKFNEVREHLHSLCDGSTKSSERAEEYLLGVAEAGKGGTPDRELIEWWMTRYDQLESRVMERSALLKKEARDSLRKTRVSLPSPFDIDLKIDVAKLRMEAKKHETASVDIWDWEEYPMEKTCLIGPDNWY